MFHNLIGSFGLLANRPGIEPLRCIGAMGPRRPFAGWVGGLGMSTGLAGSFGNTQDKRRLYQKLRFRGLGLAEN